MDDDGPSANRSDDSTLKGRLITRTSDGKDLVAIEANGGNSGPQSPLNARLDIDAGADDDLIVFGGKGTGNSGTFLGS